MRYFVFMLIFMIFICPASNVFGADPTVISTKGFSITFPEKWHVETNHTGTILAGIKGEEPPFIIIYYAEKPETNDAKKLEAYERMKKSSIIRQELDKKIAQSVWHSSETIQHADGIREELFDIEDIVKSKSRELSNSLFLFKDYP